ncbi:MAG TPA: hypothetical protein VM451_10230 [Candidatus Limnocylindria bacterium]|nr:hypothetical protein [Candidatus Limnocylindria bacterium]
MNVRQLLLTPVLLLVVACQGAATPPPSAPPTTAPAGTPSPTLAGLGGVAADLTAAGVTAKAGSAFSTEPIGGEGFALCVGAETVQTYAFIDHEAALAAQAKIDREDPSTIGTTHVNWTGKPRFWLRDNLILLYLGEDAATDAALRTLLGPPFAEGEAGGMPLAGPPCS